MIITFAQQKGGAGKTTLAAHLGHAWALAGKSVALIDLDPQRSLATWAAIPGGAGLICMESAGWRAGPDIRDASRAHDLTLVDCPGSASTLLETALRESDLVVVPCQPSVLDGWATKPLLDMAAREKTPACVVFNRVPPRGGSQAEVAAHLKTSGATVLAASLGNRVAYSNGLGAGTTALGLSRTSRASVEMMALRAEIDRLLQDLA